jgi:hypothetical protein
MLHNDVAQQRPSEQPASAPKTSQQSPRAQKVAKFKIPTLKPADSRLEDTVKTGLRDGSMATTHPIHIHGRHSPPSPEQLTTHATRPRTKHQESATAIPQLEHMNQLQPARYHSFGKGYVQANRFSDLSLVQCNISHPVRRPRQNCSTLKIRQQFCPTSPCPHHSLHDTIPLGRDTCRPARPLDWSIARSNNSCTIRRPRQCCSTHKAGQKFLPRPLYNVHDTIPSRKDTGTPAQPSDLSVGQRHNGQTGTGP